MTPSASAASSAWVTCQACSKSTPSSGSATAPSTRTCAERPRGVAARDRLDRRRQRRRSRPSRVTSQSAPATSSWNSSAPDDRGALLAGGERSAAAGGRPAARICVAARWPISPAPVSRRPHCSSTSIASNGVQPGAAVRPPARAGRSSPPRSRSARCRAAARRRARRARRRSCRSARARRPRPRAAAPARRSGEKFMRAPVRENGTSLSTRGSDGSPSTRSPIVLRRISSVPPAERIPGISAASSPQSPLERVRAEHLGDQRRRLAPGLDDADLPEPGLGAGHPAALEVRQRAVCRVPAAPAGRRSARRSAGGRRRPGAPGTRAAARSAPRARGTCARTPPAPSAARTSAS